MERQIEAAQTSQGVGNLDELFHSGETWTVG
jgi:hypothetical protein